MRGQSTTQANYHRDSVSGGGELALPVVPVFAAILGGKLLSSAGISLCDSGMYNISRTFDCLLDSTATVY